MSLDPGRVKVLFGAALDLPAPADRHAFLDRECGEDAELRGRVEELLAAYDRPAEVLEQPLLGGSEPATVPGDATAASRSPAVEDVRTVSLSDPTVSRRSELAAPIIGSVVAGRYKVREEIGEGGMGTVYLAERERPIRQKVALKVIKPGMDSRQVLARFEQERQALALMDHPNIARVLDAGATDDGRPFFVMELVKGVPLTEYCDQHRLDLPSRLALFRQICSAVQHAHQKGIIHRDLKPTNILVESHDDKPVPKVIDFGLAKATSGMQLSEHSLYSAFGSVAGTPLYMAPEQASFNALDIDTRADIYALGVILYELLTGSTPIPRETMKKAALDEMLRVIREVEPPVPSSRISSSATLPSLAASRHTEPARLSRFVRGDLDWIVMKALAKERGRRYDSAIGLGNDVERFLNDEPVSAGPPTAAYRLKKFVRRNRGRVIAASLVLGALVVAVVGTTLGLVEARTQRAAAVAQERETRKRLEQRDKANEILLSIFKDLDPRGGDSQALPLANRLGRNLDLATAELEGEATDDPVRVAWMQSALGEAQRNLGFPQKAITLAARARATFAARLGPEAPETLMSMNNLAVSYLDAGQLDRALPLFERTLERRIARLGSVHPDTLNSMAGLAAGYLIDGQFDRALPLLERTLELTKAEAGPTHPQAIVVMNNLAEGYKDAGRLDKALPLLEETLALYKAGLGPDHPSTLMSMCNLAAAYEAAGRLDEALPLFEQTLARQKAVLGPDHPDALISLANLAGAHQAAAHFDRALPLYEQALARQKTSRGPDHPDTLATANNLATCYQIVGRVDDAIPLFEATLAARKAKYGPDHPDTLVSLGTLAMAHKSAGRIDRALPMAEETLALMKARLGPQHPHTLVSMANLAKCYGANNRVDLALPLLRETLALMKAKLGPGHPQTLAIMENLATCHRAAGHPERAITLFEEALGLAKAGLGPDHPDTLLCMAGLAASYQSVGRTAEALPLYEQALARQEVRPGPDHPNTLTTMNDLASCYWALNRFDRSVPLFEETFKLRVARSGADHPDTRLVQANLGVNYLDAGRLDEARPLLEEAWASSRERPTLRFVGWRLLDLYNLTGKGGRAAALARELLSRGLDDAPAAGPQRAGLLALVGSALLQEKAWAEAEPVLRESLAIREKAEPDAWTTFNTRSMLGAALLGLKQTSEAEPFLRSGYEGMKSRADKISPQFRNLRLGQALDRLIALAEATDRPDEAKAWKEEKAKLAAEAIPKPR